MENVFTDACYLSLPVRLLTDQAMIVIKKSLTFSVPVFGSDETDSVYGFDLDEDKRIIHIPYVWAIKNKDLLGLGKLNVMNVSGFGDTATSIDSVPSAKTFVSEQNQLSQRFFMNGMYQSIIRKFSILAQSPTGSGKTVCALRVAGLLRRKTIVIIPSVSLIEQWKVAINTHLGVPFEKIGVIQSSKFDVEGKDFVIAMAQTLVRRTDSMYKERLSGFGLAIFDECHRFPTEVLSRVFWCVNCRYKLGMSATLERFDSLHEILNAFLGGSIIQSSVRSLGIKVCVHGYRFHYPLRSAYCYGVVPLSLSKVKERNDVLVHYITRAYSKGNCILVVSAFVKHLELLMSLCEDKGVPRDVMGLFVGKTKKMDRERIKTSCGIIFATYGAIKEGVDIPRLSVGIEATPISHPTQIFGRLRRFFEGKNTAYWLSIEDKLCKDDPNFGYVRGMFNKKIRIAKEIGSEVVYLS